MILNLTYITPKFIADNLDKKLAIIYGDFNVINYLYENKIKLSDNVIIYPDSTAVYLALKFFYRIKFKKIVSTDLQEELLNLLIQNKNKLFFFGDFENVLQKLIKRIKEKFPDSIISGYENGYSYNNMQLKSKLNEVNSDVLFVGLGVGRQEIWINENFSNINVNLILSVGGWFQFLASTKLRAPFLIRKLFLEWLYKLITDFNRVWKRYLFGIPKFYYRIFTKKIILKFVRYTE